VKPPVQLLPWEIRESREVYAAPPWMTVSVQKVRLPDGREVADYHQLRLLDYVIVFAQTPEGRVVVMRQYRHGVRGVSLLLPAGQLEKGEAPLACAQRELREETGYRGSDWASLGSFVGDANYGAGRAHIFKCRNAHQVAAPESDDLETTELVLLSVEELQEAFRQGEVVVAGQALAVALALSAWISPNPS
jgi:ADP-ribose pyrophosphatase